MQEEPNIDSVQNLKYTDMFIREVMRVYPIGNALSRECTNSTNVCGIDIPKHTTISIDFISINNDPEIWGNDVDEFNPLRFSPEIKRNPIMANLGFGIGPKNCIGDKESLFPISD